MSKLKKTVIELRNSFFNYYQNPVSGFRYGTAVLRKRLKGQSNKFFTYYKNIQPYDRTGFYLPYEDYERRLKVIDLQRTGRAGPKKGQGKRAKLREKNATKGEKKK